MLIKKTEANSGFETALPRMTVHKNIKYICFVLNFSAIHLIYNQSTKEQKPNGPEEKGLSHLVNINIYCEQSAFKGNIHFCPFTRVAIKSIRDGKE